MAKAGLPADDRSKWVKMRLTWPWIKWMQEQGAWLEFQTEWESRWAAQGASRGPLKQQGIAYDIWDEMKQSLPEMPADMVFCTDSPEVARKTRAQGGVKPDADDYQYLEDPDIIAAAKWALDTSRLTQAQIKRPLRSPAAMTIRDTLLTTPKVFWDHFGADLKPPKSTIIERGTRKEYEGQVLSFLDTLEEENKGEPE